jgi:dTDP-L-rhamnose 4-epimerase
MSKSKVLVTGGAGFVGSHLVDALLDRGHEVRIYDDLTPQVHSTGIPGYLSKDAEFLRGDMLDVDRLRGAVRGMDVVFHLAAAVGVGQSMYEISHYMAANTLGTANLLQVLLDTKAQVQKLVVASSMSIYGEGKYLCAECGEVSPGPRPTTQLMRKHWETLCPVCHEPLTPLATNESKPLQCTSIYALSKKDQEEMVLLFGRTYGVSTVALRYFNIYGTRQSLSNPYTGVAAIFASRLLNGRAPLIFEDGRQARDFVSVEDVTQANLLSMETAAEHVALNVGSGQPVTVRQVAQVLGQCMGASIPAEITGKYRAGDIRHCFADITAAGRVLGYSPKVPFAEGFRNLAQWLRQQTAEDSAAKARRELEMYGLTA